MFTKKLELIAIRNQKLAIKRIASYKTPYFIEVGNKKIECHPNVCPPYIDSVLLAKSIKTKKNQILLDSFSGSGIISILLASQVKQIYAIDISNYSINNIKANVKLYKLKSKISVKKGNIFPPQKILFDIIAINPPYSDHRIRTIVDRTAWDYKHKTIRQFFKHVQDYSHTKTRIYISWANFADFSVIEKLASEHNYKYRIVNKVTEKVSDFMNVKSNDHTNIRLEYRIYRLMKSI